MYGTKWCGDCVRSKEFLERRRVPYEWIDIGNDQEGQELVIRLNRGMRRVPTLVFPDGSVLVEPSDAELAKKLASHDELLPPR